MHIVETQVIEVSGSNAGYRVEFAGEGGDNISVLMRNEHDLSRENAVEKARALMIQVGAFEPDSDYQQDYRARSNGDDA